MGEDDVILGIKISKVEEGIELSHSHYFEKILKIFSQSDDTFVKTLLAFISRKKYNNEYFRFEYSQIIGSLIFLMNCTIPILPIQSKLSRYTHNPNRDHWNAIVGFLKNIKGAKNYNLDLVLILMS